MKKLSAELKAFLIENVDFLYDSNDGSEYLQVGEIIDHEENDVIIVRLHKKKKSGSRFFKGTLFKMASRKLWV